MVVRSRMPGLEPCADGRTGLPINWYTLEHELEAHLRVGSPLNLTLYRALSGALLPLGISSAGISYFYEAGLLFVLALPSELGYYTPCVFQAVRGGEFSIHANTAAWKEFATHRFLLVIHSHSYSLLSISYYLFFFGCRQPRWSFYGVSTGHPGAAFLILDKDNLHFGYQRSNMGRQTCFLTFSPFLGAVISD
ncbi:hypothetical protein F5Y12DRAFT_366448 [Xylaria sp. FL1777]|nr:hypothetical protein F5Y12DRAFT_366448 [Xylaria sp. FL1777]